MLLRVLRAATDHCDLCAAERQTDWHYEDELCWVADCRRCRVPMVVARTHGPTPPAEHREAMLAQLAAVAARRFTDGFTLDTRMRAIPDHFHAHARPAPPEHAPR